MELRVLRYFVCVAKQLSISKAAQQLFITQPTLSRQILLLEQQLNKKLFVRGSRSHKLSLTKEGILLYKRAEEIIALADKTEAELSASTTEICGDIYIGGGETHGFNIIAKTIKQLQQLRPLVRFHIFSGNSDDVTEKLDNGLLDFGVIIEPTSVEKYDYIKLNDSDVWGVIMKSDSTLSANKYIDSKQLISLPLITSGQSLVRNQISGWCNVPYQQLNIVATYNLLYNASIMVKQGIGYALGIDKIIFTNNNTDLCFVPLFPSLIASLNIVWKKNQIFSNAAKLFLQMLQANLSLKN